MNINVCKFLKSVAVISNKEISQEPDKLDKTPPKFNADIKTENIVPSIFLGHKIHANDNKGSSIISPNIESIEFESKTSIKSLIPYFILTLRTSK